MAVVQKTFAFGANLEGLADQVTGGTTATLSHNTADGSPTIGSLQWYQGTKNTTSADKARGAIDGTVTWETWGVPANATVNSVRVVSVQRRMTTVSKMSSHDHKIRVVGSDGLTVHGATDLLSESLPITTGAWTTCGGIAAAQTVSSTRNASNTAVAIEWDYNTVTSGGGGAANETQLFDTLVIEINYTEAAGTNYTSSQAGSLSFTSAMAKRISRALTGTLSFAGAITKRTDKAHTATVDFAGSTVKVTQRANTATVTFSGSLDSQVQTPALIIIHFHTE